MKSIGKMELPARGFVFLLVFALGGFEARAYGAVHALFDLDTPKGGPFPSDRFTVEDRSHLTGLSVSLPSPGCSERPSDCEDMDVINTLDDSTCGRDCRIRPMARSTVTIPCPEQRSVPGPEGPLAESLRT